MKLQKVTDPAFKKYGKIVENVDFSALVEELKKTPCTQEVVYEPSVESLEALPVYQALQDVTYGEMPIQIGYCNGNNEYLNALEYHRTSEIDVAANDLILLLGCQQDIEEGDTYDTAKVRRFFCPPVSVWSCMPPACIMRPAMLLRKASAARSYSRTEPTRHWTRIIMQEERTSC